ncbi:Oidioi.mRNA.OKI2018_I69.XSR.g16329.t1.cds [Oikopleura dioica]|uniref:Oidioi.mRNA.OKI2018_I69.XSR.g16329.t1.cds n=1 Tax=Oikopleura dioica TaxID=34765 RepID=A0ABN7SFR2_OIKDI|nr:Oidioi.mRNA.OKI2018_I69.XSR.g16329.t1.cds [Oikopleura dioica]
MQQIASYTSFSLSTGEAEKNADDAKAKKDEPCKLGTLMGVYLPCVQNIFGVILFIRMPWIVGLAGIWEGLGLIFFCCLTTMLTAISMSAIATNGRVPAGGSYYMISRSLGPGWGAAVGMMFYFGTTIAAAMYIIGSIEIVTLYMGVLRIFDIEGGSFIGAFGISGMYDNFRIWGTILLIIMCLIVLAGMKYVNKSAMPFLICVIVSILALFVGFFASAAGPNADTVMCMVGDTVAKVICYFPLFIT